MTLLGWDYYVYVLDNDPLTMPEFMNLPQTKAHCQEDSAKELCGKLCVQAEYSEDYENQVDVDSTSNIFTLEARQSDHVHQGASSGAISETK